MAAPGGNRLRQGFLHVGARQPRGHDRGAGRYGPASRAASVGQWATYVAAETDGYTAAAIGRTFGLSRTSVTRVLSRDADRRPS